MLLSIAYEKSRPAKVGFVSVKFGSVKPHAHLADLLSILRSAGEEVIDGASVEVQLASRLVVDLLRFDVDTMSGDTFAECVRY